MTPLRSARMKQKILLIEDERPIVEVLTYNLTKEGFEVYSRGRRSRRTQSCPLGPARIW